MNKEQEFFKEVIDSMNEKYDLTELSANDYRAIRKLEGKRIVRGKQIAMIEKNLTRMFQSKRKDME